MRSGARGLERCDVCKQRLFLADLVYSDLPTLRTRNREAGGSRLVGHQACLTRETERRDRVAAWRPSDT